MSNVSPPPIDNIINHLVYMHLKHLHQLDTVKIIDLLKQKVQAQIDDEDVLELQTKLLAEYINNRRVYVFDKTCPKEPTQDREIMTFYMTPFKWQDILKSLSLFASKNVKYISMKEFNDIFKLGPNDDEMSDFVKSAIEYCGMHVMDQFESRLTQLGGKI